MQYTISHLDNFVVKKVLYCFVIFNQAAESQDFRRLSKFQAAFKVVDPKLIQIHFKVERGDTRSRKKLHRVLRSVLDPGRINSQCPFRKNPIHINGGMELTNDIVSSVVWNHPNCSFQLG